MDLMAAAREHADTTLGTEHDWGTAVKVEQMYTEAYAENERFDTIASAKEALSEQLHENWRKDIEAGFVAAGEAADTPRLRPSKDATGEQDAAWFADKEARGVVFDTDEAGKKLVNTNVAYEELPPSWQKANEGAAGFVVDAVVSRSEQGIDVTSDDAVEDLASAVHDKWMQDNAWQRESNPGLFVPYHELPEDEKKKDRDQVLLTVEKLRVAA